MCFLYFPCVFSLCRPRRSKKVSFSIDRGTQQSQVVSSYVTPDADGKNNIHATWFFFAGVLRKVLSS